MKILNFYELCINLKDLIALFLATCYNKQNKCYCSLPSQ